MSDTDVTPRLFRASWHSGRWGLASCVVSGKLQKAPKVRGCDESDCDGGPSGNDGWRGGLVAVPQTTLAETADLAGADILRLADTLRMDDTFAVMVEEGQAYGTSIEEQMFPGQGGPRWSAMVATIYDAPKLRQEFEAGLLDALGDDPTTVAAAQAFFDSDLGQRVLQLEIEARRTLLDEAAEEAARVEAERMQVDRDPRFGLIRDMAEAGDLIEMMWQVH